MTWQDYSAHKQVDPTCLPALVQQLRQQGLKIATLNGSFDLLHAGHLFMIYEASKTADKLIIALNTDRSVQLYKGPTRPIIPLAYRMEMLTGLAFVDYVTWFDESDPRELLKIIRPDVHVNGMEYGEDCIEAGVVREVGASLHLVPRIPGLATSQILEKIQNPNDQKCV